MRRFSFRLQRVLKVREIQQQQARGAWARARTNQTAHEQRLAEIRDHASADATGIQVGATMDRTAARTVALRSTLRATAVSMARADLDAAAEVTAERAVELQQAAREVRTLERLSARQRQAWATTARRAETRELDDIAGQRAERSRGPRADDGSGR